MSDEQTTERDEQEQDDQRDDEERDDEEQASSESGDGDDEKPDEEKSENELLEEKYEQAKQEVKDLEDDPPQKLEDWPTGKAMYETFGGGDGDHGYHEGPEMNLGPDSLRHFDDGSVEVKGEKVDDAEKYKGEPIPGGPTDPESANQKSDKAAPEDSSTADEEGSEEDADGSDDEKAEGRGQTDESDD
ncbi:MAG TPA: hypothetical protein VIM03_09530 [Thermoleophilaceae bacterium]